jgi:hypothetical protein
MMSGRVFNSADVSGLSQRLAFHDDAANQEEFIERYRVHGDCVFFPGPSRPTERLQHQPDTENPNVHPASTRAE